jgi:hypothetical protein
MNEVLRPYLDRFCLVYLIDILIYSRTEKEHVEHRRMVLDKLRVNKLYCKLSNCEFLRSHVSYLERPQRYVTNHRIAFFFGTTWQNLSGPLERCETVHI